MTLELFDENKGAWIEVTKCRHCGQVESESHHSKEWRIGLNEDYLRFEGVNLEDHQSCRKAECQDAGGGVNIRVYPNGSIPVDYGEIL